jgi:hypothetical protein
MELKLDPLEYVPQLSVGSGFRVAISDPRKRPRPAENGLFVATGSNVDIGFQLQTVERLPAPYESRCWNEWDDTPFQLFHLDQVENKTTKLLTYSFDVSHIRAYCYCRRERFLIFL